MPMIVFHNGSIAPGTSGTDADRLVVRDDRIVDPSTPVAPDATWVDLDAGWLGPAFGDGHAHLLQAGREGSGPQIRSATSVAELVDSVRQWASEHPEAPWIVGASYDATLAPEGRFDARWLDAAVPDRPVVLRAWDYHTVWCNSLALELAGLDAKTPDPADGIILRRPDGSLLGTLIESGATGPVLSLLPETSLEDAVVELERATAQAAAYGISWVQDAWVEPCDLPAWLEAARRGVLSVDADLALRADPTRWEQQRTEVTGLRQQVEGASGLSCRTLKFFLDGIIENHTAYLLEDYVDRCTRGLPVWRPGQLNEAFVDADRLGFDLHLHAIGDGGVRQALDAAEHLRASGATARRITLAHAQLVDEADLRRFAELDVTVCFQPLWAAEDAVMRDLTLPRIGAERALQYRIRSILDAGATISFGSDWPVTSPDVLAGIRTAVTRQTPDGLPAGGWQPSERISLTEALAAATTGVAHQSGADGVRGVLRTGAQADLVWLSADPRAVTPDRLVDIDVRGTWRRGLRTH
ncbi:MAG TPA: amidohydrolase [Microlunatus sp.]|nr:amidohydrolase [Microlunatus sp.]